jgi:N6-adenosine-specific RNA methylase IME4
MELPKKKYKIIYADPPWSMNNKGTSPCLKKKLPLTMVADIPSISKKDSILFLWGTTPMIKEALEVMEHWGFKYKTIITWEKTNNDCMGYWFRVCTEHLLVGIKGNIKSFRSMNRTCYHEKRGKHSKKPEYFRKLITEVCGDLPRIELFARERKKGWDSWGNEAPNHTQAILTDSPVIIANSNKIKDFTSEHNSSFIQDCLTSDCELQKNNKCKGAKIHYDTCMDKRQA